MTKLSVLDLAPIVQGGTAADAFAASAELAQAAEALGYHRYWLAEHHNMPGIASAATAVVIGHVAAATRTIRVGAGGVMLPNHAPLVIAEQFGTLASLFPGRIDLGLGRAPGTDQATAHALRRNLQGNVDQFPADVQELLGYFGEGNARVQAVPGRGLGVPIWILGSSLYGASLAAAFGLPYAFASHFAPQALMQAIELYRERFQPSAYLDAPYVMLGYNVCAADTEEEAQLLRSSGLQAILNLRRGMPGPLPPPVADFEASCSPADKAMIDAFSICASVGTERQVAADLQAFVEQTGADELMIAAQIYDQPARRRSYEIAMTAARSMGAGVTAAPDADQPALRQAP